MNGKAALAMALLEGRILNVSNCFKEIGLSNIGREIPRLIEQPFDVIVSRVQRAGKNRYGSPVSYTDYRLNKMAAYNLVGIEKMRDYIKEHTSPTSEPKKQLTQNTLF